MRLSRLEIFGFKSFPYRLELEFGPGITAIVGPNGCGKTNIFEAIRWALGEQAASALRSETMEEVIFAGTKELKPLSIAEVTLVLDNNDGRLPVEYSEVEITRRIFRSGESEYFINKNICRLKDITDILLNTGLGSDSYSTIELKMVDLVLSDDPAERRRLFEEAAEIAKYRNQRKISLKKLEATEGDLLRISDIIAEVEKRVKNLKKQAKQAEIFGQIKETLKEKEIIWSKNLLRRLMSEKENVKAEKDELLRSKKEIEFVLSAKDKDFVVRSTVFSENEIKLREIQVLLDEVIDKCRACERENIALKEKVFGLRENIEKIKLEILDIKEREKVIENKLEENKNSLGKIFVEKEKLEKNLISLEEDLTDVEQLLFEKRIFVGNLRKKILEKAEEEALERSQLSLFGAKLDETQKRRERIQVDVEIDKERLRSIEAEIDKIIIDIDKSSDIFNSLQEEVERLKDEKENTEGKLENVLANIRELEKRVNIYEREQEIFKGISDRYGSLGVRSLLSKWGSDKCNSVAEVISVDEKYSKAIETGFGERLEWIILSDINMLHEAICFLREEGKGKVTFVLLEHFQKKQELEKDLGLNLGLGMADKFVICDEKYRNVVESLLKNVYIVKDFEEGLALLERYPGEHLRFVSLNGELVFSSGFVTININEEVPGAIESRSRVERLKIELEKLFEEIRKYKDKENELRAEIDNVNMRLFEEDERLETESKNIEEKRILLEKMEFQRKAIQEKIDILEKEFLESDRERESLEKTFQKESGEMEITSSERIKEKENLFSEEKLLEELEGSKINKEKILSDLKLKSQEFSSEIARMEEEKKRLLEEKDNYAILFKIKEEEYGKLEVLIRQLEEKIAFGDAQLLELERKKREYMELRGKILEDGEKLLDALRVEERTIVDSRKSIDGIQERIYSCDLRLNQINLEENSIVERIKEEYGMSIKEDIEGIQIDSEDALKEEIEGLRQRIRRIGAVNFMALEEYKEEEERYNFLCSQRDDILSAKEDLMNSICKMDETARVAFLKTFDAIKQGYGRVFRTLFSGGETDMRLTGSDDPLEAEIEILANPEGKKLQSIRLLSGGERTLTAISLLFGIYLVKPAPFCVLDEVDAPLDDANIERFITLLREFSKSIQFAIITHNKKTMEASDKLYGVTMEQPGISKVVSVSFGKERKEG